MAERIEFTRGKRPVTFIDLFAGAGGISEGFLQSCANNKYFKFILASDINPNCELTHIARYNTQLGIDMDFITEDIMSETFIGHLLEKLNGREIDVVTGGPSCQSFSLAGARKKFDKRDNLFIHYLNVIRQLRPKYFVMENVEGILTKNDGKFKDAVMSEIRSIIDDTEVPAMLTYLRELVQKTICVDENYKWCLLSKIGMELCQDTEEYKNEYFKTIDKQFKQITKKLNYKLSKSDERINTIRHGLLFLQHSKQRDALSNTIINSIITAIDSQEELAEYAEEVKVLKDMIKLYSKDLENCFEIIEEYAQKDGSLEHFRGLQESIHLYNLDNYILVNSSNYGVPQTRKRFICVGLKKGIGKFVFPQETHSEKGTNNTHKWVTCGEVLSDFDNITEEEKKQRPGSKDYDLLVGIPPGKNYLYYTEHEGYPDPIFKWKSRYWTFLLKLTPNRPSWTIQASFSNNQGPFHWKNRFLRISEIKRLQTFDDDYKLCGDMKEQWRQVGNAVPAKLAEEIAKEIKKYI